MSREKLGMPCSVCNVDTSNINEYYMVKRRVWLWVTSCPQERKGYLCIGCLEKRLGRKLLPEDFTGVPVNRLGWLEDSGGKFRFRKSRRLVDRLGHSWSDYLAAVNDTERIERVR